MQLHRNFISRKSFDYQVHEILCFCSFLDSDSDSISNDSDKQNNEKNDADDKDEVDTEYCLKPDYHTTIRNMRKIVKFFKLSAKRNEIFSNVVKKKFNKNIRLVLDSPTRWSSLQKTIDRFLELRECVEETLNHKSIKKPEMWSQYDNHNLEVSNKQKFAPPMFL